ncbi:hypothetical protein NDU88_002052 [Pleurodeles waltl]|uniref:Uncharacterized protein n=1 Tax=Pleurodeles waltl TaxID=8319 RepID=A0AAV7WPI9_PLEWA|nr:hypothetical protein NDU88_002052 [Pleurodeles waltl]
MWGGEGKAMGGRYCEDPELETCRQERERKRARRSRSQEAVELLSGPAACSTFPTGAYGTAPSPSTLVIGAFHIRAPEHLERLERK